MIDYAKLIKEYRERKFLTQTDFAKLVGVSFPCVTRWENGKNKPTIKMKKKLCQLFIDAGMKVEK